MKKLRKKYWNSLVKYLARRKRKEIQYETCNGKKRLRIKACSLYNYFNKYQKFLKKCGETFLQKLFPHFYFKNYIKKKVFPFQHLLFLPLRTVITVFSAVPAIFGPPGPAAPGRFPASGPGPAGAAPASDPSAGPAPLPGSGHPSRKNPDPRYGQA